MDRENASDRPNAPLQTPADFSPSAVKELSGALAKLLADMVALYVKTKNFHWHMSGPDFRDYHLLLDDQADQISESSDAIAERARKIGGITLKSVAQIGRLQRILDNEANYVTPMDMLVELQDDNLQLAGWLREVHGLCEEYDDVATASLVENWIDQAEKRVWFLFETTRPLLQDS
jgi:starvation-inducible DNA-binding protein